MNTALADPLDSVAVASVMPFSEIVTVPVGAFPVIPTVKVRFAVLRMVGAEAEHVATETRLDIVCVTTLDVLGALLTSPE